MGAIFKTVLRENVPGTADIITDSFSFYRSLKKEFRSRDVVDHDKEYVRGITNTYFAESYFYLLKRGAIGTFHRVSV